MGDCIFCGIIKNEIPSHKIYEDKDVVAILDIKPATKHGGHILVLPKEHLNLITDVPDDLLIKIIIVIKKLSNALLKFSEGVNILQNNKEVAGQSLPHIHFHLIPRFKGDNVRVEKWDTGKYKPGEAEKVVLKIKSLLK